MIKEKLVAALEEYRSYSHQEKFFIFATMVCSICICSEFAISRPVANALFVTHFGSKLIPYAWLAIVPLNFLIVSIYNRYFPKLGCFRMFLTVSSLVVTGSILGALFLKNTPALAFIFFVWKEVYILLMFQQLWSIVHSTIKASRAKYLYGILFAVGGVGGLLGSFIPRFLAVKFGSESLLLATIPLYTVLIAAFFYLLKHSRLSEQREETSYLKSLKESVSLIGKSPVLLFVLCAVICMSFASSLVDFQFNSVLEKTILNKDLRTEYYGRMFSYINTFTIMMQLIGTFSMLHFFGLRKSHYSIPIFLGLNSLSFLCFPLFGVISCAFVSTKATEFSFFSIIKEMMYIPLGYEEKFKAKPVIDVFIQRTAKSLAALLIIASQFFFGSNILTFVSFGLIIVFLLWGFTVRKLCHEHPVQTEITTT